MKRGTDNPEQTSTRNDETLKTDLQQFFQEKKFRYLLSLAIFFQLIMLGLETNDGILEEDLAIFLIVDGVIVGVFVFEAYCKIAMNSFSEYVKDKWNVFDFLITVLSVAALVLLLLEQTDLFSGDTGHLAEAVPIILLGRIFRVLRVLRIIIPMRDLVESITDSYSGIIAGIAMFGLLFYIYAVFGVILFAEVDHYWEDIPTASFTLFQIYTLENWPAIFNDTSMAMANIDMQNSNDGNGSLGSVQTELTYVYFISFIVLSTAVIFQIMGGIIHGHSKKLNSKTNNAYLNQNPLSLTYKMETNKYG